MKITSSGRAFFVAWGAITAVYILGSLALLAMGSGWEPIKWLFFPWYPVVSLLFAAGIVSIVKDRLRRRSMTSRQKLEEEYVIGNGTAVRLVTRRSKQLSDSLIPIFGICPLGLVPAITRQLLFTAKTPSGAESVKLVVVGFGCLVLAIFAIMVLIRVWTREAIVITRDQAVISRGRTSHSFSVASLQLREHRGHLQIVDISTGQRLVIATALEKELFELIQGEAND